VNQIVEHAIVLSRLNYGEADKILTVITPNHGKLSLIAKGVRKVRSKLAGGIELFSVSTITYIPGKKDIGTLVSTRLQTHYGKIIEDIDRTMLGYDILKMIHKATKEQCESSYYLLLVETLANLDDKTIDPLLTRCWFMARLLSLLGHAPNTVQDVNNNLLIASKKYQFNYEEMSFYAHTKGSISANHIKLLRLLMSEELHKLLIIKNIRALLPDLEIILRQGLHQFIFDN
jgi:DNA repair protein RecO (recombination protein O)